MYRCRYYIIIQILYKVCVGILIGYSFNIEIENEWRNQAYGGATYIGIYLYVLFKYVFKYKQIRVCFTVQIG